MYRLSDTATGRAIGGLLTWDSLCRYLRMYPDGLDGVTVTPA